MLTWRWGNAGHGEDPTGWCLDQPHHHCYQFSVGQKATKLPVYCNFMFSKVSILEKNAHLRKTTSTFIGTLFEFALFDFAQFTKDARVCPLPTITQPAPFNSYDSWKFDSKQTLQRSLKTIVTLFSLPRRKTVPREWFWWRGRLRQSLRPNFCLFLPRS